MSETTAATPQPVKTTDLDYALGAELASEASALARVGSMSLASADRASIAIGTNGTPHLDTLDKQLRFCALAVRSRLVPVRTVAEAWVCLMRGHELGIHGLRAFDYIYPVDGKPRLTPDGAKAVALATGLVENFSEPEPTGTGDERRAIVTIKRRDIPTPIVRSFSIGQAKTAGLADARASGAAEKDKKNWKAYPDRMLMARARGWAWGDAFRDILAGMQVRERDDLDDGERIGGAVDVPPRVAMAPTAATAATLLDAVDADDDAPGAGAAIEVAAEVVSKSEPADVSALEPEPVAPFDAGAAEDHLANAVAATVDEHERADVLRTVRPAPLASQADLDAALVRLAKHPASRAKPAEGAQPTLFGTSQDRRDRGPRTR